MASKSNTYGLAAAPGIGCPLGEAVFHAARHCATSNGGPRLPTRGSARGGCGEQAAKLMQAIHPPASCLALRVNPMPPAVGSARTKSAIPPKHGQYTQNA